MISLPTLSTTVSAQTMLDAIDVDIAATEAKVDRFLATGEGSRAALKREVERLFGARAFVCNVIGPKLAKGQCEDSRALFDRVDSQWERLSGLGRRF